jgi:hypothetical protein
MPRTGTTCSSPQATYMLKTGMFSSKSLLLRSHDVNYYLFVAHSLFQMDLSRHVANGQLSSLMGEATLRSDRLLRILGAC